MDVIVARIVSGEMVIGKKTETGIKECLAVRNKPVSQTEIQTMLTPVFIMMSADLVEYKNEHIVTTAKPDSELEKEYLKSTSSIIRPTANETSKILRR